MFSPPKDSKVSLVQTLIDCDQDYTERALPKRLKELYDGDLLFPKSPAERPFVFANFVSTLDGVVSYEINGHAGGATISGFDLADRFIIGLLRASADAVIVGARTVHAVSPKGLWTPEYTYPDAKHLFTEYRLDILRKPQYPLVAVVSGSGKLDLERAIFRTPGVHAVIITTPAGRDELARVGVTKLGSVQTIAMDASSGSIAPAAILRLLNSQFGVRMLLHEGGPTLFGQFLGADAVDELFLTVSPQIAGRKGDAIRPALVQGVEFVPDRAPWFQLLSVKQNAEYLYLRYRRSGVRPSMS